MTVSRVLNNKPDVAAETRQRILDIMEEYQYKPHAIARKLSGAKTNIIGVALYTKGKPLDGLYVEVLQGLQLELSKYQKDVLLLAPTEDQYGRRVLQTNLLDGVVLMGDATSKEDISNLHNEQVPFITIGQRQCNGFLPSFVAPDYQKAFREVMCYAKQNKAEKITVIIAGLDKECEFNYNKARVEGIKEGADLCGYIPETIQFISSNDSFEEGYQAFSQMSTFPDFLVLDSSEFSFGAVMALRDQNQFQQDKIQLVGIDYENQIIRRCGDVLGKGIPRWHISWMEIGKMAGSSLLSLMDYQEESPITQYLKFRGIDL
jgi:LacI family transcriptional regulator